MIEYVDNIVRLLILTLICYEKSRYVRTFKFKDRNNELMSFHTNNEKILRKYKTIWANIEVLY